MVILFYDVFTKIYTTQIVIQFKNKLQSTLMIHGMIRPYVFCPSYPPVHYAMMNWKIFVFDDASCQNTPDYVLMIYVFSKFYYRCRSPIRSHSSISSCYCVSAAIYFEIGSFFRGVDDVSADALVMSCRFFLFDDASSADFYDELKRNLSSRWQRTKGFDFVYPSSRAYCLDHVVLNVSIHPLLHFQKPLRVSGWPFWKNCGNGFFVFPASLLSLHLDVFCPRNKQMIFRQLILDQSHSHYLNHTRQVLKENFNNIKVMLHGTSRNDCF